MDCLPLAGNEQLLLQPDRLLLDERQISQRFPLRVPLGAGRSMSGRLVRRDGWSVGGRRWPHDHNVWRNDRVARGGSATVGVGRRRVVRRRAIGPCADGRRRVTGASVGRPVSRPSLSGVAGTDGNDRREPPTETD